MSLLFLRGGRTTRRTNDQIDRKFTLALGLALFPWLYNSAWHLLMAASMLVVAPVLMFF